MKRLVSFFPERPVPFRAPLVLPDISPTRGEITRFGASPRSATSTIGETRNVG